jgi:hypothetical protein
MAFRRRSRPFTGTTIVNVSLRYMSTTSWYHFGEFVRVMNN